MTNYRQRVRANIKAELGRLDRRQSDAAALLGFSQATMTNRMAGRSDFQLGELLSLAAWLGVSLETLLHGVEAADERPPPEFAGAGA